MNAHHTHPYPQQVGYQSGYNYPQHHAHPQPAQYQQHVIVQQPYQPPSSYPQPQIMTISQQTSPVQANSTNDKNWRGQ